MQQASLHACTFSGESFSTVWGPVWGRVGDTDTCAPCAPRESLESMVGRAISHCPHLPPEGLGLAIQLREALRRCPQHFGQGLGCGIPSPPLTCVCAWGRAQAPAPPGPAGVGQSPHSGAAREQTVRQKLSAPSSLPELDSGGLRERRREERKGGREERGLDRSATLLAAWPGWCSLGNSEHAHWGGIKRGQPERPACLLARGAASREQRAVRQPAPLPRPGQRGQ